MDTLIMWLIQNHSYSRFLDCSNTFIQRIPKLLFSRPISLEITSLMMLTCTSILKTNWLWYMVWKDTMKNALMSQKLSQNRKISSVFLSKVQDQHEYKETVRKWQWLMKIHGQCQNTQCQLEPKLLSLLYFKIKIGTYSDLIIKMHYLERSLNKKLKTWKSMLAKLFTQISLKFHLVTKNKW